MIYIDMIRMTLLVMIVRIKIRMTDDDSQKFGLAYAGTEPPHSTSPVEI